MGAHSGEFSTYQEELESSAFKILESSRKSSVVPSFPAFQITGDNAKDRVEYAIDRSVRNHFGAQTWKNGAEADLVRMWPSNTEQMIARFEHGGVMNPAVTKHLADTSDKWLDHVVWQSAVLELITGPAILSLEEVKTQIAILSQSVFAMAHDGEKLLLPIENGGEKTLKDTIARNNEDRQPGSLGGLTDFVRPLEHGRVV